jgi:cold shock CspA family protein
MKSRILGRCVSFNGSYAFLRPIGGDGKAKDVFAHESELPDGTISVGDKVTFDVAPDTYKPGRMRATNVRLVDGDRKPDEGAGAGMYKELETDSALAAGLRKLIGDQ